MSLPAADGMQQGDGGYQQLPSIPILHCRWGLGEGVSPMVFKPQVIPRHLLRAPDEPPPDSVRRLRGRGRAAGLSSHEDPMPVPGELTNVGVSNLSIREQINRVRGDLPIYEPPTDYSQYILPRRSFDDGDAPEPEPRAAGPPPRRMISQLTSGPSRRGGWAESLDCGGEVKAVESALLPRNMSADGGGDAGLRALQRYNRHLVEDSDDADVLEMRTNSSDSSNEFERPRAWRPRPPALNEQSFPPLPGAAPAPAVGRGTARSPSKSDRSSSEAWSAAVGGSDSPSIQPQKRGGRKGRRDRAAAGGDPAAVPKRRGGRPARQKQSVVPPTSAPSAAAAASSPLTASQASDDGAASDAPSGRVRVTGVTAGNWQEVQQYVSQYGTVKQPQRGDHNDGWFTVSPEESAEWIVSVHSGTPCDIPGVQFHLAEE